MISVAFPRQCSTSVGYGRHYGRKNGVLLGRGKAPPFRFFRYREYCVRRFVGKNNIEQER